MKEEEFVVFFYFLSISGESGLNCRYILWKASSSSLSESGSEFMGDEGK